MKVQDLQKNCDTNYLHSLLIELLYLMKNSRLIWWTNIVFEAVIVLIIKMSLCISTTIKAKSWMTIIAMKISLKIYLNLIILYIINWRNQNQIVFIHLCLMMITICWFQSLLKKSLTQKSSTMQSSHVLIMELAREDSIISGLMSSSK